eukprot:TRINITY_DN26821_c0_g1_i1.p1 TRINITY_DN26821_c0_g1~~TRINITY_DN26821_c0_g1_i1.p1  ORF type:complete len:308 (+),score=92.59 TRINITY_DN26821_c0_g1_i1:116-1039(+)
MSLLRSVRNVVGSIETKEGAGFIVHRGFPTKKVSEVDPFLMLDHFGPVHYGPGEAKGAPWHPHRGFETISYILQGENKHQDSMGNKGYLRAGDVQWMTAGSGIIHDEGASEAMLEKGGVMEGFQIWVNLPREKKMIPPYYQDVNKDKIPSTKLGNTLIKVIAGEAYGCKAIVETTIPIIYLDVHTEQGESFELSIPSEMNAVCYVYRGKALFGPSKASASMFDMVQFNNDGENIQVNALQKTQFIVLAGKPIKEPIARYGPFVMNTQEEILQAFQDYQTGNFVKHKPKPVLQTQHETSYDPNTAKIV